MVVVLKAEVSNRTLKKNKRMMDPLIYVSIPWRDLTDLLEMDGETQSSATKSMPERLQRLMDKQPEQEDDVRLTTADLQWIRDHISQVGASQCVYFCFLKLVLGIRFRLRIFRMFLSLPDSVERTELMLAK